MDAIPASAESYADRDLRLRALLSDGVIFDPERWLFLRLLDDLPAALVATPLLYDVSWGGGRFDLLFTDGLGTWCAVEVKDAPAITRSGSSRKNCKTTWKRRRAKLVDQTWIAALVGPRLVGASVIALGLWHDDGEWHVVAHFDSNEVLAACA